jgi:hypothetical protein
MSRNRVSNTSTIVVVLIVAAVLALALRPGSTETEVLPEIPLPDPGDDPAAAVVVGLTESGGFSLLGIQFGTVNHVVGVQFYAGPGCFDLASVDDPWPTPFEECSALLAIEGTISGGGIALTGEAIVVVDVSVPGDCFEAISRGDRWPPAADACSSL